MAGWFAFCYFVYAAISRQHINLEVSDPTLTPSFALGAGLSRKIRLIPDLLSRMVRIVITILRFGKSADFGPQDLALEQIKSTEPMVKVMPT
jgi:hypothetical protein